MKPDEASAKEILLSLVDQNRKNPKYNDHIPNDVTGWRFSSSDQNNPNPSPETNEQHSKPVCEWTGVTCDPIDGTITGLNLGQGFLIEALLGGTPLAKKDDDRLKNVGDNRNLHYQFWEGKPEIDRNLVSKNSPSPIAAKIPSNLGKLISLRAINLSFNQLQGEIPKSVTDLPFLEIFEVTSNDLIGTFPRFISDTLRILDISKNRFHGTLPADLFGHYKYREKEVGKYFAPYLSNLVKLDMSHNGFNGTIPLDGRSETYDPETGFDPTLRNLQYFDIGYNMFSGTICNNFGLMASLEGLFMEHNRLVGTIPKALFRGAGIGANPLPLSQLFLHQNELSGTLPSGLSKLPNLKEVYVDGNKLTGSVPRELCQEHLNESFLFDKSATNRCDGVVCPANSFSKEGMAPCTACPDDGGYNRYIGQRGSECEKPLNEVEILDLFYEQTNGDKWTNPSYSWETGSPACARRGIKCDDSGKVAVIALPSLGLKGPILSEIGHLSSLKTLDLSNNDLTGFVPSDIRFTSLVNLDLRNNRLEGVVPPMLCIKEGVNNNGDTSLSTDFNLVYACDNFMCARGSWSPIGRAALKGEEVDEIHEVGGAGTLQCLPCYDDAAKMYMGRDSCSDVVLGSMHIRMIDIRNAISKTLVALPILVFIVGFSIVIIKRRKTVPIGVDTGYGSGTILPGRKTSRRDLDLTTSGRSLSLASAGEFEDYSDDDWTAADSERGAQRVKEEMIELAPAIHGDKEVI